MAAKIVIPSIPTIYKIAQPILFDDTTLQKRIIKINPGDGNTAANLNNGSAITFSYTGENKWFNLSDPETGFWITIGFRTRADAAARDMNANITLANMWWAHMFTSASFRLGDTDLETVNEFGVVMETLCHLKGDEFRKGSGEDNGFIPDTGTGTAVVPNGSVVVAAADTAANTNVGRAVAVTVSQNNEGYLRRKTKYNYGVTGNDVTRFVKIFVPAKMAFGSCEPERVLRNINFEFKFNRKQVTEIGEIFFGSGTTTVQFDGADRTGIINMSLQVIEYLPHPDIAASMTKYLIGHDEKQGLIHWAFRERKCHKASNKNEDEIPIQDVKQGHPAYIYIVGKGTTGNANQRGLTGNFSLCRHCDIKSVVADIDGILYPDAEQNEKFGDNMFSEFYQQFKTVCRAHGNECAMSSTDYQNLYTIFAIDCGAHIAKAKNSQVSTTVTIKRNGAGDNNVLVNPATVDYYMIVEKEKVFLVNCLEKKVISC